MGTLSKEDTTSKKKTYKEKEYQNFILYKPRFQYTFQLSDNAKGENPFKCSFTFSYAPALFHCHESDCYACHWMPVFK